MLCFDECVILKFITSVSFSGALQRKEQQVRLVLEFTIASELQESFAIFLFITILIISFDSSF